MIISRTPYRMSFFGGGTDYHPWYQEHGSAVLSATMNHYCYLTCRFLPPFFNHKSRVVWSRVEEVAEHQDIEHPAVKAVLEYLKLGQGVEIQHQGDLPARSGLGSSSAFTVGLLNVLYGLLGLHSSKQQLACEAVHIERDVLKENVGVQDQIATAYGGLNKITIQPNGEFAVQSMLLSAERQQELQQHVLLFYTGVSRFATHVASEQINNIKTTAPQLHRMREFVNIAENILLEGSDLTDFGRLLHEAWLLKRSLAKSISTDFIDDIYQRAQQAGALGGKVLGAGGGGFMMFFVAPEHHAAVMQALSDLLLVPFEFEHQGSQLIFSDQTQYSRSAMARRDFSHLQQRARAAIEPVDINQLLAGRKTRLAIVPELVES